MPQIATVGLVGGFRDDGGIGAPEEPAGFRRNNRVCSVLRDSSRVKRKDRSLPQPIFQWGAGDGELALAGVRASSTGCPCGCCKASAGPAPGTASKGSGFQPAEWESVLRAWAMTWVCYFFLLPPYPGGFSRKASDSHSKSEEHTSELQSLRH